MANQALVSRYVNAEDIYVKFTLSWDFIKFILASVTSGDIALFSLPQGSKVTGVVIKHSERFAGVAGTFKVSLGIPGNAVLFTSPTLDLVATAVADATLLESGGLFNSGQLSSVRVVANFVSSSGLIGTLTAGSVDIYVRYFNVFTPGV